MAHEKQPDGFTTGTERYRNFINTYVKGTRVFEDFDIEAFGRAVMEEIKRQEPGLGNPTFATELVQIKQSQSVQEVSQHAKEFVAAESRVVFGWVMVLYSAFPGTTSVVFATNGRVATAIIAGGIALLQAAGGTALLMKFSPFKRANNTPTLPAGRPT